MAPGCDLILLKSVGKVPMPPLYFSPRVCSEHAAAPVVQIVLT
jgi:hypothetical protein